VLQVRTKLYEKVRICISKIADSIGTKIDKLWLWLWRILYKQKHSNWCNFARVVKKYTREAAMLGITFLYVLRMEKLEFDIWKLFRFWTHHWPPIPCMEVKYFWRIIFWVHLKVKKYFLQNIFVVCFKLAYTSIRRCILYINSPKGS
jgi:hypothetical protein